MNLGIRFHDTKNLPLEERIAEVKNQGFGCAHVALSKALEGISVADSALTPGFAMYLKRQFAKHDLDIAVLGCYLNLADPNKEALRKTQHKYMAHIRFASMAGVGVVGTETGAPNETYTSCPECRSEEALQQFIEGLRPVVAYAETMGVIVAIEPVVRHIVYDAKRARQVLDAIDSPNLMIIFDPVNLLDETNCHRHVDIIKETIDLLGQDVAMVHIKDYKFVDGKMVSCAAGTGEMHYEELLSWMKKEKPFVHATLEDTVPENAVAARKYIQEIWDRA